MCVSVYYNLKSNSTHTSYVELADAPVVPAVAESHRSYETSATSPDEVDVYDHDQAVGIEVMPLSEKTQITCNGLMPLEALRRFETSCKPLSQWSPGVSRRLDTTQGKGPVANSLNLTQANQAHGSTADLGHAKYYFLTPRAALTDVIDV
jgi:hypothetical protein